MAIKTKKVKKKVLRYKSLKIARDCLVPKGAMQVKSVFKEDTGEFVTLNETPIYKFDDEKQLMYNIMVKFGKTDSQNMILDNEDVRRDTLIDFIGNGDKVLKFSHKKDDNGEPFDIEAVVCGADFVRKGDPMFPDDEDSIYRVAFFKNKDEFDIIKTLKFESSIEGVAELESIEIEVDEPVSKEETEKASKHKIDDLLLKIFNIKVTKDFDTTMENKKNTDLYIPMEAMRSAIWQAEYKLLYGKDRDIKAFKKEFAKICKQTTKYINNMSFETIKKEEEEEQKPKGDGMEKVQKDEVVEIIQQTLGLEKGQTLESVIANAVGKIEPPKPTVIKSKDAEGKEIDVDIVTVIAGLAKTVNEIQSNGVIQKTAKETKLAELEKEIEELKKGMTDPNEIVDENIKKGVVETEEQHQAGIVG